MDMKLTKEFIRKIVQGYGHKYYQKEPDGNMLTVRIDKIVLCNSNPALLQLVSGDVVVYEGNVDYMKKNQSFVLFIDNGSRMSVKVGYEEVGDKNEN